MKKVIYNGSIVNEGERFEGYLIIGGDRIEKVGRGAYDGPRGVAIEMIDARGGYIIAGAIDDQVHFRDPGLTYKADIATESLAAVAGGVTSYMEMPNTVPQTTTIDLWERKMEHAASISAANYSFYLGATNDNLQQVSALDPRRVPGVKVFMGSSTGGMLVDNQKRLEAIFAESPVLVAIHSEDEALIQQNIARFGHHATIADHSTIRSEEACYRSTARAIEIAAKYNTRLHVLHLSTGRELTLFESRPLVEKRITNEVCVHHLWFSDDDYAAKGNFIKWNPSIKTAVDRAALREGLANGRVDIIATDHAPHTLDEKLKPYLQAPSGGPLVQHSLVAMLEMFPVETVVDFMSHRPAICFNVAERGYLREGYFADIVIVEREPWEVTRQNILYKCGWSPFEGVTFSHRVSRTLVNGVLLFADGELDCSIHSKPLTFNR